MKHEGSVALQQIGVTADRGAVARLEAFESLLIERAVPLGMIAASDVSRLHERHVLDCARAAPLLPAQGTVCDLGSGAGLPGVVLAILRPDVDFVLIEVRRNRAAFLEAAVAGLTNVSVHARRLETFRRPVDACTARAFAPPSDSWDGAAPLLGSSGFLVYWAGRSYRPSDGPSDVSTTLLTTPALAGSGPLVIMAQQ